MEPFDPPFQEFYKKLFDSHFLNEPLTKGIEIEPLHEVNECEFELPLIDLSCLHQGGFESEDCKQAIAKASQEWGFFQVVNHGVSSEILDKLSCEQAKAFKKPFLEKVNGHSELNFPADSYRWGTPSATCLRQLAWSEAFHVPLMEISTMESVTGPRATDFSSSISSPHESRKEHEPMRMLSHKSWRQVWVVSFHNSCRLYTPFDESVCGSSFLVCVLFKYGFVIVCKGDIRNHCNDKL